MNEPKRFRKKDKGEVEAVQWTGGNREEVEAFADGATVKADRVRLWTGTALVGDWIVKDGDGAQFVRTPKTFETTYEPAPAPVQKDGGGHWVEIEFDGFYPSVKLIHPEGGCPMPDAVCESCGRDLRKPDAESCHDCKAIVPGYCALTDWVEAEGHELVRGKITLPFRTEWTDCDHPLLHLLAASTQPASPSEEGPRCGGTGELWTQPPEGHVGSLKYPCPGCPDCRRSCGGTGSILISPGIGGSKPCPGCPDCQPTSPSPVGEGNWPSLVIAQDKHGAMEVVAAEGDADELGKTRAYEQGGYETCRYIPASSDKEAGEVES